MFRHAFFAGHTGNDSVTFCNDVLHFILKSGEVERSAVICTRRTSGPARLARCCGQGSVHGVSFLHVDNCVLPAAGPTGHAKSDAWRWAFMREGGEGVLCGLHDPSVAV